MRAIFIISFLALTFTAAVRADITLRYDVMRGDKTLSQHQVLLKQNKVRISNRSPHQQDFMLDLKSGDIIQLNKQQKSYFTINTQTLNQYVSLYRQNQGLFQGLINQGMSQLDPQQQARVQRMMKNFASAGDKSAFKLAPTRHRKQILGVSCQVIQMWQGQQLLRDICVASYADLQLPADVIDSFERLKKLIGQFRQQANVNSDLLGMMAQRLETLQGLPMEIVERLPNGKVRQVTRLANISLRGIAPDLYRIPPGFQQKMMPVM